MKVAKVKRSVLKRVRQAQKRRERNRAVLSSLKTQVKKVVTAIEARDKEGGQKALVQAVSALHKAAQKRVIHKNKAARKISRLTRKVNALALPSAGASPPSGVPPSVALPGQETPGA